jgi:hypothetical protein
MRARRSVLDGRRRASPACSSSSSVTTMVVCQARTRHRVQVYRWMYRCETML